jgi:hypothetical protein
MKLFCIDSYFCEALEIEGDKCRAGHYKGKGLQIMGKAVAIYTGQTE